MFNFPVLSGDRAVTNSADHLSALTQLVSSPLSIGLLLERVMQQHGLLSVFPGEAGEAFTSVILAVEKGQRYMVLDELSPTSGQDLVRVDPRLRIEARLDGVELSFSGRIAATGDQKPEYYKVPFPAAIEHRQKRNFHRASIPLSVCVPLALQTENGDTLRGELRDISVGGFSARLHAGSTDAVLKGTVMPRCLVTLPTAIRVSATVEICHLVDGGDSQAVRVGARFYNLSRSDERHIEKFIAALERDLAKKQIKH